MLEALPLSEIMVGVESGVGWICAIDEAKICGHEIEGASIRRGLILQEVTCDGSVVDIGSRDFGAIRLAHWEKST